MPHRQIIMICLFASTLTGANGIAAVHYVDVRNNSPVAPFSSWTSAATNIQDAVDVAAPGDEVAVTNGVYDTGGGRVVSGLLPNLLPNRVVIDKPLIVRSVNGSSLTIIKGAREPGSQNGDHAMRCVYLTAGASLVGFTLTNGATMVGSPIGNDLSGGGAFCEYGASLVRCVVVGNSSIYGGGVAGYGGLAIDCLVKDNVSDRGGGAWASSLSGCRIVNNQGIVGGGMAGGFATNCIFVGNSATDTGGGAVGTGLTFCTIVGNSSSNGGGISLSSESFPARNCVIYNNTASSVGDNWFLNPGKIGYCCTYPTNGVGDGCTSNEPAFVDTATGNFRLRSDSPCIDVGLELEGSKLADLDGRPRHVGPAPDMGAYEYQGPSTSEFIGWLESFGLPVDGSADKADPDGDQANSWEEWRARTDPTDAQSVLRLSPPEPLGDDLLLTWHSVSGQRYFLVSGADIGSTPASVQVISNIVAAGNLTTITDTNAARLGPRFYRVGVE
jgi:hypothetical protein